MLGLVDPDSDLPDTVAGTGRAVVQLLCGRTATWPRASPGPRRRPVARSGRPTSCTPSGGRGWRTRHWAGGRLEAAATSAGRGCSLRRRARRDRCGQRAARAPAGPCDRTAEQAAGAPSRRRVERGPAPVEAGAASSAGVKRLRPPVGGPGSRRVATGARGPRGAGPRSVPSARWQLLRTVTRNRWPARQVTHPARQADQPRAGPPHLCRHRPGAAAGDRVVPGPEVVPRARRWGRRCRTWPPRPPRRPQGRSQRSQLPAPRRAAGPGDASPDRGTTRSAPRTRWPPSEPTTPAQAGSGRAATSRIPFSQGSRLETRTSKTMTPTASTTPATVAAVRRRSRGAQSVASGERSGLGRLASRASPATSARTAATVVSEL